MIHFFKKYSIPVIALVLLAGNVSLAGNCAGGICYGSYGSQAPVYVITPTNQTNSCPTGGCSGGSGSGGGSAGGNNGTTYNAGEVSGYRGGAGADSLLGGQDTIGQRRQEDGQQCQSEANGLGALNKLAGMANPNSLQNIVKKGLSDRLGESIRKIWAEKIPDMLRQNLTNRLPGMIKSGLSRQLPNYVNNRLNSLRGGGYSNDQLKEAFPSIIAEAVRTLLPIVIQQSLQQLVPQTLQQNVPAMALEEIQTIVPDTIDSSVIPGRVEDMFASSTAIFPNENFSNEEITEVASSTVEDISTYAVEGIAQSDGFNSMINTMVEQMSAQIIPSLSYFINSSMGGYSGSYAGGSWSPQTLDGIFNQGTGGVFGNFSIEQGLFKPVFDSVGGWATDSTVGAIRDWQTGESISGVFSQVGMDKMAITPFDQFIQGPGVVDMINKNVPGASMEQVEAVYNKMQTDQVLANYSREEAFAIINSDSYQNSMSSAAQQNVANNTQAMGNKAANKFSWSGLGNDLKASFASGTGDMLGGLIADNVPFVGGLLGGIVDQYVTGVLNQLLGVAGNGTGVGMSVAGQTQMSVMPGGVLSGLAGADYQSRWSGLGLSLTGISTGILSGFTISNINTGATAGNTKTSNKNEEKIIKLENEIKTLNTQICTLEKQLKGATYSLEDLFYKYNELARWRAAMQNQRDSASWQKFVQTGRQESGDNLQASGPNGSLGNQSAPGATDNGQPLISKNADDTQKNAANEEHARTVVQVNQSGNKNTDQINNTLQNLNEVTPQKGLASTVSQSDCDKLRDSSLDGESYWDVFFKCSQPWNDAQGSTLMAIDLRNQNVSTGEQRAREEVQNGQGYLSIQRCTLWSDDPAAGAGALAQAGGTQGVKGAMASGYAGANNPGHYCLRWEVVVPASDVRNLTQFYQTSVPTQVRDARNHQDDAIIALGAQSQRNFINYYQPGSAQQAAQIPQKPCPGTDPCPDLGQELSQGLSNGLNNLTSQGSNYFDSTFGSLLNGFGGGYSNNSGGQFDFSNYVGDFSGILSNIQIPEPAIEYFRLNEEKTKLEWSAKNSLECRAENDWAGTEIKEGQFLKSQDSISITTPDQSPEIRLTIQCFNFVLNNPQERELILPATNQ